MADMANIEDVETAFEMINKISEKKIIPITYMNSSADIKAFVGKNNGAVCTSSNANAVLEWAFTQGQQALFIPDEHLGRNTAYKMGIPLEEMMVLNKENKFIGNESESIRTIKMFLWKGHCSVHMNFRPEHVDLIKKNFDGVSVIVHPECVFSVVQKSDYVGSTSNIIKTIEKAPDGSRWAIGTEHHLVNRLAQLYPKKKITTLAPFTCQCSTMYRISPESLLTTLEKLSKGEVTNQIRVSEEIKKFAKISLQKMLEIH
jgi:quinolinate synthase